MTYKKKQWRPPSKRRKGEKTPTLNYAQVTHKS
jgi:hypothetical protein